MYWKFICDETYWVLDCLRPLRWILHNRNVKQIFARVFDSLVFLVGTLESVEMCVWREYASMR